MTNRCPQCDAANQPGALFCLGCGEPLGDVAPLVAAPAPAAPDRPRWAWLRGREWLVGVGLAGLIVALVLYSTWQGSQDRQGAAYQRALGDLQNHGWEAAIADLRTAGDYADAPRRLQDTTRLLTQLHDLDDAAGRAEQSGAWWDAAAALRQLVALDPTYPKAADGLATARQHAGVIVYRVAGAQPGTWWVHADGGDPRIMPGSPDVEMHGISPDGRWAVYTLARADLPAPARSTLDILNLESGALTRVPLQPPVVPAPDPVHFRADSTGFWWVANGRWNYYDFAGGTLTPIPNQVVAADLQSGQLIRSVRGPSESPLDASSVLVLTDALGRNPQRLLAVPGPVVGGSLSPDGHLLLYQTREPQGDLARDVLWAVWLPPAGRSAVQNYTVLGTDFGPAADPPPLFTSAFLPIDASGSPLALVAWAGHPVQQVTAALDRNLEFAVSALQLGPNVGFGGLLTTATGAFEAVRVHTPTGQTLDWLGFAPGHRAIFYRGPAVGGRLALYITPDDRAARDISGLPRAPLGLLTRPPDPAAWTHSTGLSHDGSRLLAIRTAGEIGGLSADPPSAAGLWAVRLDGTDPQLVMPGALEFWTPDGWLGSP